MKLTFLGAAETVTGSKYLLEAEGKRILIDCGLFQGKKDLRLRNWDEFPVPPSSISSVILTHAHLDHSGYLPVLIKRGFRGPVYATTGTRDLCKILLPDSGKLQEEEASYANKRGFSKHKPALPLYTKDEGIAAIEKFVTADFGKTLQVDGGLSVSFYPAGHILGSASLRITDGKTSVVFSGDLGRSPDLIMKPPVIPPPADYVVIESTYGNRAREPGNPLDELAKVLSSAIEKRGVVVIPAFAVGRSQALLFAISELKRLGRIPDVPVYLNSPMSVNSTDLYCAHFEEHILKASQCKQMCNVARYVHTVEESKDLNKQHGPMIIVSASGMATGGRVVHHLKSFAPDPKNTILLAGFQAAGTRGAALRDGVQQLKIHGEMVPVRANVVSIDGFSAHADRDGLLDWLRAMNRPREVFVTHGEVQSALAFAESAKSELGLNARVPKHLEEVEL